jgi:hypothetical protein
MKFVRTISKGKDLNGLFPFLHTFVNFHFQTNSAFILTLSGFRNLKGLGTPFIFQNCIKQIINPFVIHENAFFKMSFLSKAEPFKKLD